MQINVLTVLVIFYLYLLVRWQHVKRPFFYLVGILGIVLVMAAGLFGLGNVRALEIIGEIFQAIGAIIGFLGAVAACFGDKLPGFETPIDSYQPPKQ